MSSFKRAWACKSTEGEEGHLGPHWGILRTGPTGGPGGQLDKQRSPWAERILEKCIPLHRDTLEVAHRSTYGRASLWLEPLAPQQDPRVSPPHPQMFLYYQHTWTLCWSACPVLRRKEGPLSLCLSLSLGHYQEPGLARGSLPIVFSSIPIFKQLNKLLAIQAVNY